MKTSIIKHAVIVILWSLALAAAALAQGDFKPALDQINALRAEPERAAELLDQFVNDAFPDEAQRANTLKDKYGNKTSRQFLDEAAKFVETLPKMPPLAWDADFATFAAGPGTSANSLFKPLVYFASGESNAKKAMLWMFLRGEDWKYKAMLNPAARFAGMGLKGGNIAAAVGATAGKSVLLKDAEFAGRPYDPREDATAPWDDALSVKQPNITSFVRADGSLDVVWRDMGAPPRVYLTRFAAGGARVFTKEIPGADPSQYQLLAGFTEDPDGNVYVLRARDEGRRDAMRDPVWPLGADGKPDPNYDRPDAMKLTKLDKDLKEIWTKNLAKNGGKSLPLLTPLSPNTEPNVATRVPGHDAHSSTSRIGFYVHNGTPIIFALYGAATDWDADIKGRHQNAYWRTLDARTGEPVAGLNGQGMAHSFDSQLLVTDEGIITAERSDSGLLIANYLKTRSYPLIFHFFYGGPAGGGNECYTQLGSLQPAADGYLVAFVGNNWELPMAKSLTEEGEKTERLKQRNLAVIRVKKGFAQQLDALEDGTAAEKKTLETALNSMQRSEFREGLNLTGRVYLTSYDKNESYSASRPKMTRLADGNYVLVWERWTHGVNADGNGVEGSYESTWAVKINQDGEILKEPVKLSDALRITRGDEPVRWNGKMTFLAGDVVANKLIVYALDGDLKLTATPVALN